MLLRPTYEESLSLKRNNNNTKNACFRLKIMPPCSPQGKKKHQSVKSTNASRPMIFKFCEGCVLQAEIKVVLYFLSSIIQKLIFRYFVLYPYNIHIYIYISSFFSFCELRFTKLF